MLKNVLSDREPEYVFDARKQKKVPTIGKWRMMSQTNLSMLENLGSCCSTAENIISVREPYNDFDVMIYKEVPTIGKLRKMSKMWNIANPQKT